MPLDPTWRVQLYDADGNSVGTSVLTVADLAVALAATATQFPCAPTAWAQVTGKPSTFTPSAHSHAPSEITGTAVVDADARLTNNRKPGFVAGDGGTVTQTGNKGTAVTLNKLSGDITTTAAALAAGAIVTFTLNDSAIVATDQVVATHHSGGTVGPYLITARATGAGTATISIRNTSAASLSEAIVIRFSIIRTVNS